MVQYQHLRCHILSASQQITGKGLVEKLEKLWGNLGESWRVLRARRFGRLAESDASVAGEAFDARSKYFFLHVLERSLFLLVANRGIVDFYGKRTEN